VKKIMTIKEEQNIKVIFLKNAGHLLEETGKVI
jgi:hypothetical protein